MSTLSLQSVLDELNQQKATYIIDIITEELKKQNDMKEKSSLYLYRSLAYLSLEAVRMAIKDCAECISRSKTEPLAYFIQGLAYLWSDQETKAVEMWASSYPLNINFPQSFSVYSLVYDHNFRSHFYNLKFNVPEALRILNDVDLSRSFTGSDTQTAYQELRHNSFVIAITYFSLILRKDQYNLEALRGRGVAYC